MSTGANSSTFPMSSAAIRLCSTRPIERMRTGSEAGLTPRSGRGTRLHRITEQHYRADVTDEQRSASTDLGETYLIFDRLRREGRDTVWAYVARNLSRPLAFRRQAAGRMWWSVIRLGSPFAT